MPIRALPTSLGMTNLHSDNVYLLLRTVDGKYFWSKGATMGWPQKKQFRPDLAIQPIKNQLAYRIFRLTTIGSRLT